MEFVLQAVDDKGVVHDIPLPVAKYHFLTVMENHSKVIQKELILTIGNNIRLPIPVSEEDAEWIGEPK